MTTQVMIVNKGPGKIAIESTYTTGQTSTNKILEEGQFHEIYCYNGQDISIKEIKNGG